jgi:thiol:disulfide interchange protein DsbC
MNLASILLLARLIVKILHINVIQLFGNYLLYLIILVKRVSTRRNPVNRSIILVLSGLLIITTTTHAKPKNSCERDCAECHSLSSTEAKIILKDLGDVKSVWMSPVKGLWEITLEKDGRQAVARIDFAKKRLVTGPVFEIATGKQLTTAPIRQKETGKIDTSSIPLTNAVLMGNPKGTKKLFLFTDPDCPFCRTMHAGLVNLEQSEPDVAIYVLLFPRPNQPDSYDKSGAILAGKAALCWTRLSAARR